MCQKETDIPPEVDNENLHTVNDLIDAQGVYLK